MKRLLLASAIILCSASFASADAKFDKMDTDANGSVSWEEFSATHPQMRKPAFQTIDANSDNAISHDEWHEFLSRHGAGGEGMGGGMGKMGGQMPPKGMGGMSGMPIIKAPDKE